jgi:small subunit ribosomal protein S1
MYSLQGGEKQMSENNGKQPIDPWSTLDRRYKPGQLVTGTVTRIAPFGVFARIEDGLEGLVRLSELPSWLKPLQNLREGQQLPLRILSVDAERHHMELSLKQVGGM